MGNPTAKINKWMKERACNYVVDRLTSSERCCELDDIRRDSEAGALGHWLPLMTTSKEKRDAKEYIRSTATSASFIKSVRRLLRDNDGLVSHLVSETYFECEEHWGDEEWMHAHRSSMVPTRRRPGIALVLVDFDPAVGTAAMEHLGKTGEGLNKHVQKALTDMFNREVLTDEVAMVAGAWAGEAELAADKHMTNEVFREAYLKVVGA